MLKSDNNCSISVASVSRGAKYFFGSMLSRRSFCHSLKKALFWKQRRRCHSITQSWCRAVAPKQGSDYRCHLARECLLPTTKTKAQCWVKIGRACNNAARNRIETGLSYSLERWVYYRGILKLVMWINRGSLKCKILSSNVTSSPRPPSPTGELCVCGQDPSSWLTFQT